MIRSLRFIWLARGISAAGAPTIAQAEVHIEGTLAAVHVTTDKDTIPDVLSAFETAFVSSVYSGSLTHVISRLLGGYDYMIARDQGTIDIVIWGKHGEAPAPIQKPVTAPSPSGVTALGPRVSDISVDPKTYPIC
jgi:hypothetical protein